MDEIFYISVAMNVVLVAVCYWMAYKHDKLQREVDIYSFYSCKNKSCTKRGSINKVNYYES